VPVDRAVILAGGRGSRLFPYTTVLPKPLLPVGNRAILDIVVRQLAAAGVPALTIATGYLAHLVRAVFGDGSQYGITIDYHEEPEPLGTAGPLAAIDGLDHTFLAMNGDVLTTLDPRALVHAHRAAGNVLTIAGSARTVRADYGVMQLDGAGPGTHRVQGYDEKPETQVVVSMGIYVLEPQALRHIPTDGLFDIPDLVLALIAAGEPVGAHVHDGYWRDIGRHDDYEEAQAEIDTMLPELLPA
jgi:NDP-sugar pyrophosphorylase family protein